MKPLAKIVVSFLVAALPTTAAVADDGFIVVDSLDAVRQLAAGQNVKVRLKPGTYRLDTATSRHFITFSGANSHWDFRGVKLEIDNALFRQSLPAPDQANNFTCAIAITGDRVVLEGLTTVNLGSPDRGGIQGKNKIISVTGSDVVLRDIDITTVGSSPWGYGSLFGISSGDVRKMNGIRVGWPARGVKLVGCRVHMRAMGHAIFVQGARDTLIEDCHVDGLLRPTNEIVAEKSGYALERNFSTRGQDYIEGVNVAPDGKILPDEMIALSEDGIRLYDRYAGEPTGRTTIRGCTVTRMRRGICTGLGPGADVVIDCEVRDCVAAGFNIGSRDTLRNCRADAKYAEALCLPYVDSQRASVEVEVLDSRAGLANSLLAVVNGANHHVVLRTNRPELVPPELTIQLATRRGYAYYQRRELEAREITLINETPAAVVLGTAATANEITSHGGVRDQSK